MTPSDFPAADVQSAPSAAGNTTGYPRRRNEPWQPTERQRHAINDCRDARAFADQAEAHYWARVEEALSLGVPESRLSMALDMSDAAIRMARKRRRRSA